MQKYGKFTLYTSIIHFSLMFIFMVLMFTLGNKPGVAHPLITPFLFYAFLSFLPPIFSIITGIISYIKEERKTIILMFTICCILYEFIFWVFVIKMWPAWMGI